MDLIKFLFEGVVPGKQSPIDILSKEGLIDAQHVKNIEKLLNLAENIQMSGIPGTAVEFQTGLGDEVIDVVSKMVGSAGAGSIAKFFGSKSPSLIVHGAGSRFTQNAVKNLPMSSTRKVLVEAVTDPEKMALLLQKVDNPADKAAKAKRIHAWFVRSGLYNIPDSEEESNQAYGVDSPQQSEQGVTQ